MSAATGPFSPHKFLNHFARFEAVAQGAVVPPITVEIDPTNVCNHRCRWCVSTAAHTGEELGTGDFGRLVRELHAYDVKSVVLKGGGEPTLHRDFNVMVDLLAARGLPFGLITNGALPWPGCLERLAMAAEWVRFSLDAAEAETHRAIHGGRDFKRVLRHVEYLAARQPRPLVGLNFVVEERNYREVVAFTQRARDMGVAYVSLRSVYDPERPLSPQLCAEFLAQVETAKALANERFRVLTGDFNAAALRNPATLPFPFARCLGPNLVGVVGADGEVYACCFLRGLKAYSFGNIREASFEEIWTGPRRQAVMAQVYSGSCQRVCAGGRTGSRYDRYNEILNYMAAENRTHAEFL